MFMELQFHKLGTRVVDFIGLYYYSLLIFFLYPLKQQKGLSPLSFVIAKRKKRCLFVFNTNIWQKYRIFATSCKTPHFFLFFFAFQMTIQKVCRVCNKFLKDTKRSNAIYCGKRCKNKAVTLRKNESALNEPKTAKTIDIEHPLYGAPNIYELYKKGFEIQGQLTWHEKHGKQIREIDALKDKMRQIELNKINDKQAIQEKFAQSVLFAFTNIINKIKDKPQSGLMPLTNADLNDF
jgi:hypothetical protein